MMRIVNTTLPEIRGQAIINRDMESGTVLLVRWVGLLCFYSVEANGRFVDLVVPGNNFAHEAGRSQCNLPPSKR